MSLKIRFVISLAAIIFLSWLDIYYVGSHIHFSAVAIQAFHFVSLMITMAIGWFNWKDYPAKWLPALWLGIYGIVILLEVIMAALYLTTATRHYSFIVFVLYLRNRFVGPLPFLVFYLFSYFQKSVAGKR